MLRIRQTFIPPNLNVEYKKKYARHFNRGILKDISHSEAYLLIENEGFIQEYKRNDKDCLNIKDEISIILKLGQRERTLQASVISNDTYGVKIKFHFYSNREYQIVDDLIYFIEKSKEKRRQSLDFIFSQTF